MRSGSAPLCPRSPRHACAALAGSLKCTEDHLQNSREPGPISLLQRSRLRPTARSPPRKRTAKLCLLLDFSLILPERIAIPLPLNRCQRLIT